MLRNITRLESAVSYPIKDAEGNEINITKVGHFYCDNDTPLQVVNVMLKEYVKYVDSLEQQAKDEYDERIKAQQASLPVSDDCENIHYDEIKVE